MEQRIFDQLDVLERGARNASQPRLYGLIDRDARHSTYDDHGLPAQYRSGHLLKQEEPLDVPMALDSFGMYLCTCPWVLHSTY